MELTKGTVHEYLSSLGYSYHQSLFWYDFDLLCSFRNAQGDLVVVSWIDVSPDHTQDSYVVFPVTQENMDLYLQNKITLLDLEKRSTQMTVIDFDGNWNVITFSEFPEEYRPTSDSWYSEQYTTTA